MRRRAQARVDGPWWRRLPPGLAGRWMFAPFAASVSGAVTLVSLSRGWRTVNYVIGGLSWPVTRSGWYGSGWVVGVVGAVAVLGGLARSAQRGFLWGLLTGAAGMVGVAVTMSELERGASGGAWIALGGCAVSALAGLAMLLGEYREITASGGEGAERHQAPDPVEGQGH